MCSGSRWVSLRDLLTALPVAERKQPRQTSIIVRYRQGHWWPRPVINPSITPRGWSHFMFIPGFPLFYWQKIQDFSRTFQDPMKNFPGPFRSRRMFKYKEETAFRPTYNIQSVVHCRKFSMKQNVDVLISCSEFRWTYLHMVSIYMQWL